MDTPIGSQWWPNELWGRATRPARPTGTPRPRWCSAHSRKATRARPTSWGMPHVGDAAVRHAPVRDADPGDAGMAARSVQNRIVWHDDFVATEISQVGTQFDGLQPHRRADRRQRRSQPDAFLQRFVGRVRDGDGPEELGLGELHRSAGHPARRRHAASRPWTRQMRQHGRRQGRARDGVWRFLFPGGRRPPVPFPQLETPGTVGPFPAPASPASAWTSRWVAEEVKAGVMAALGGYRPGSLPGRAGCAFCLHQFLQTLLGIVDQKNLALSNSPTTACRVHHQPVQVAPTGRSARPARSTGDPKAEPLQTGPRPLGRGPSSAHRARRSRRPGRRAAGHRPGSRPAPRSRRGSGAADQDR